MREFKCVVCGSMGIDNSPTRNRMFCCDDCKHTYYYGQARKNASESECPHNDGVLCGKPKCKTCGWNPDVEKRRKEKLKCKIT